MGFTVFVLGAGASVPFGLPTGRELRDWLVAPEGVHADLRAATERFAGDAISSKHAAESLRCLGRRLAQSGLPSIDAFLEHETNANLVNTARFAIAWYLLAKEREAIHGLRHCRDWHEWFFQNVLHCGARQRRDDIAIVSFNYDRLFECAMATMLAHCSRRAFDQVIQELDLFPIVHIYGKLSGQILWDAERECPVAKTSPTDVLEAGRAIRVMRSDGADDQLPELIQAREWIARATRIVFLGFGFERVNCRRLGFPISTNIRLADGSTGNRHVLGTGFDLRQAERAAIASRLGLAGIGLGEADVGCLDFLRNSIVPDWLDSPS